MAILLAAALRQTTVIRFAILLTIPIILIAHTSNAFTIQNPHRTNHYYNHHYFLTAAASPNQDDYEIERYKNRATLTETILKEKVQQVKLLKGKVEILQNVVKQLQVAQKTSSDVAASTTMELQDKLQRQEQQRDLLTRQMETLQDELTKAKSDINTQAKEYSALEKQLKLTLEKQKNDLEQSSKQQQELSQLNQNKIKAMQQEVLDLDQSLEVTQAEMKKLNRQLADREHEIRSIQRESQKKEEAYQQQLNRTLENAIYNQTLVEVQRMESIEIASAAVKAAEKREMALQQELKVLQAKYDAIWEEQQQLLVTSSTLPDSASLQRKVDDLSSQLQKERLLNESNRKLEQERFESMLEADRTKYEMQLKKLQMRNLKRVGDAPVANDNVRSLWSRVTSQFRRKEGKRTTSE